jgi:MoxR-like ATPase
MNPAPYYQGQGKQPSQLADLPIVDQKTLTDPSGYLANPQLVAAVDVALTLGMPLLITGEPGLGKSRLADSIAWERGLGEPLKFAVKSDTRGQDLFYTFDTLGRFHAAHTPEAQDDPRQYLKFSALGQAILLGKDQEGIIDPAQNPHTKLSDLGPALKRLQHPGAGAQKVVLIDEIDKAPRDVPNDILNEIDNLAFQIPELDADAKLSGLTFKLTQAEAANKPIVIITSNSEKGLPDPFLRRCVYHHIKMPEYLDADAKNDQITVEKIVTERLGKRYTSNDKNFVQDAIGLFRYLREQELGYKPSLAELLNWLDFLLPKEGKPVELPKRLKDLPRERCLASVSQCLLKNEKSQRDLATLLENRFK